MLIYGFFSEGDKNNENIREIRTMNTRGDAWREHFY